MARKGNLFVISGPSGAGKGTLVHRLLQRVPDVWASVSATTRNPRPGEIDGVHYYFMDDAGFDRVISEDGFIEWAHVHGHRYGTLRSAVQDHIDKGEQVILEIDVQGGAAIKEKFPKAHLIFIAPPSFDALYERLCKRGTEDKDTIYKRMETAKVELSLKNRYDICFVNDDLDQATDQLVSYVNAQAEQMM